MESEYNKVWNIRGEQEPPIASEEEALGYFMQSPWYHNDMGGNVENPSKPVSRFDYKVTSNDGIEDMKAKAKRVFYIEKRRKNNDQVEEVFYILENGPTFKANNLGDIMRTKLINLNTMVKNLLDLKKEPSKE